MWRVIVVVFVTRAIAHACPPPMPEPKNWAAHIECAWMFEPCINVTTEEGDHRVFLVVTSNAKSLRLEWSDGVVQNFDKQHFIPVDRSRDVERVRLVATFADGSQRIFYEQWRRSAWSRFFTAPLTRQILLGLALIGLLFVGLASLRRRTV